MKRTRLVSVSLLLIILAIIPGCSKIDEAAKNLRPTEKQFVTIGTGGVTGVYYSTGGAISRTVNAKGDEYNLRVTVESTGGSVYNVNGIMAGDFQFGIVQSDIQHEASHGEGRWEGLPQEDLRSVFSIHPESVSVVAADDSGIYALQDMAGKIINIGNPGSGQRANAIDALTACGIDYQTDFRAENMQAAEAAGALQDGLIDAYFYTVGHPNSSFKEATTGARHVHIVDIMCPEIETMISENPYYVSSVISIADYPNASNTEDVNTFGVKATLCTSASVSDEIVYAITKEVFENFEAFKALHPAYAVLEKEDLLTGLTAPIHPGAERYYKEAGISY